MTTNGNDESAQWEQFTRDALHMAGHTDAQIDAMRLKAIEDAKPKPVVIIPWRRVPEVDWDKYYADEAAKKVTAKLKRENSDRLAAANEKLAEAEEDAERYKRQRDGYENQYRSMMKAQRSGGQS